MPLSYVLTSGNGATTNFAVPFQYINQANVHVYISGVETMAFTWVNASTIQITPAPPVGVNNIEIRRVTERGYALVDYNNGSVLFDTDLDISTLQALFISQEYFEQATSAFPSGHTLDSHADATPGESIVKGAMRVYDNLSKTRAIIASDGGILQGDVADNKGVKFLPVGTTGQVLEVDTALGGKLGWKQGLRFLIQAAGDLIVGLSNGAGARLAAPLSSNLLLVSDTVEALKMKWSSTLSGLTINSSTLSAPQITGSGTSANGSVMTGVGTASLGSYRLNSMSINSNCTIDSGITIPSPTISSPTITGNTVGTGALKTATGSATSSSLGASGRAQITLNDYSFSPNIEDRGDLDGSANIGGPIIVYGHSTVIGGTTARFSLFNSGNGTGGYQVSWRYMTASDNPVMWAIIDPLTGGIIAMWSSDDPTSGDIPGVEMSGLTSVKLVSKDLEHLSILNTKASEAADLIRDTKRKMEHQAYRALQLLSNQDAPSQWLYDNLSFNLGTNKVDIKQ